LKYLINAEFAENAKKRYPRISRIIYKETENGNNKNKIKENVFKLCVLCAFALEKNCNVEKEIVFVDILIVLIYRYDTTYQSGRIFYERN